MQLPKFIANLVNPTFSPETPPEKIKKLKQQRLLLLGALSFSLVIVLLALVVATLPKVSSDPSKPIGQTDPEKALEKSEQEKQEASKSAQEAAKPINRLQEAFDDIIGSNSLKKKLAFDDTGLATVDYVISSNDGIFIIKTSYENFADFATKVFTITEVQKLSVSSYATKFVDQFGQPNQVALKLEITRETNSKVNWAVKKYAYKDYPTILTTHELSTSLSKDYQRMLSTL